MKKLLMLIPTIILAGCATATVPVEKKFPKVPEELLVTCPDLAAIKNESTKFSEVIEVVSENYHQYHECRIKVNSWIGWYNQQKNIFENPKSTEKDK